MSKKKEETAKVEAAEKGPWHGKEVPEADLKRILAEHEEWLLSEGKSGKRADLSGAELFKATLAEANLRNADLSYAKFSSVDLSGSRFDDANLSGAQFIKAKLDGTSLFSANCSGIYGFDFDFSGANIYGADFSTADLGFAKLPVNARNTIFDGANLEHTIFGPKVDEEESSSSERLTSGKVFLTGARFKNAKLRGQEFGEAIGLEATAFAGAAIPDVTLPQRIADFPDLIHIQEIAKHARTIFLFSIAACVFVLITLLTGGEGGSQITIPIFGVDVSRTIFNWVAPFVLLIIYLHLMSYLERMWRALAGLPAVFPDGRSLEERAYPWMMTSLLFAYMPLIKKKGVGLWLISLVMSIIFGWAFVPLTILSFSSFQAAGANVWQEIFFIALFGLSAFIGLSFLADARWQLKNQPKGAQPFDDCLPYDWRKK